MHSLEKRFIPPPPPPPPAAEQKHIFAGQASSVSTSRLAIAPTPWRRLHRLLRLPRLSVPVWLDKLACLGILRGSSPYGLHIHGILRLLQELPHRGHREGDDEEHPDV